MRGVVPVPAPLAVSKSGIFLLDALVGGGVCIEAADLAEPTVPGPSSPTVGNGFTGRIRLTVSVCSEYLASLQPMSPACWASVFTEFEGLPRANFCGERRNSGLEAYGSEVSQVTRGSKKLDSSFGVVKESRAAVVGVLVGV